MSHCAFLASKGYDLDHHLAAEERADSLAFKVFCRETLLPAVVRRCTLHLCGVTVWGGSGGQSQMCM